MSSTIEWRCMHLLWIFLGGISTYVSLWFLFYNNTRMKNLESRSITYEDLRYKVIEMVSFQIWTYMHHTKAHLKNWMCFQHMLSDRAYYLALGLIDMGFTYATTYNQVALCNSTLILSFITMVTQCEHYVFPMIVIHMNEHTYKFLWYGFDPK